MPKPWAQAEQHNASKGTKLLWALSHLDLLQMYMQRNLLVLLLFGDYLDVHCQMHYGKEKEKGKGKAKEREKEKETARKGREKKEAKLSFLIRFQVIYSRKPKGLPWKIKGKFPQEITLRKTKQRIVFLGP